MKKGGKGITNDKIKAGGKLLKRQPKANGEVDYSRRLI
jgi:hypothetical protein